MCSAQESRSDRDSLFHGEPDEHMGEWPPARTGRASGRHDSPDSLPQDEQMPIPSVEIDGQFLSGQLSALLQALNAERASNVALRQELATFSEEKAYYVRQLSTNHQKLANVTKSHSDIVKSHAKRVEEKDNLLQRLSLRMDKIRDMTLENATQARKIDEFTLKVQKLELAKALLTDVGAKAAQENKLLQDENKTLRQQIDELQKERTPKAQLGRPTSKTAPTAPRSMRPYETRASREHESGSMTWVRPKKSE